jgi:tRNA/rRNA methyltransferase
MRSGPSISLSGPWLRPALASLRRLIYLPATPSARPGMIPPVFILVRPQMGENIGAAARAMLNFGLERMRVVGPRDGWPNPKAVAMASGAGRVLDHAGLFADLGGAVADCDFVFATTARGRELVKEVVTPERAMAMARAMGAEGKRVGVLFGPERAGLENDDIVRANAIVTVPVNPEFPSLNLGQCVLLLGYEWQRQGAGVPPSVMELARTDFASREEVERLGDHFEERLMAAGFFFPETKVEGMKANLRNMWGRLGLTRAEVQTFHGMLRQIAFKLKKQGD